MVENLISYIFKTNTHTYHAEVLGLGVYGYFYFWSNKLKLVLDDYIRL